MKHYTSTQGDWVFLTPVANLVLTKAVNREFRIERVTFIHKDRLPYVRKRLGIKQGIAEIKDRFLGSAAREIFDASGTLALVRQRGKPKEVEATCFRLVREALSILALSQLGYAKRRYLSSVHLYGEHEVTRTHSLFLNTKNTAKLLTGRLTRNPSPLLLDADWKRFQKEVFFWQLIGILNGDVAVGTSWRRDLRNAAILAGQSLNSDEVPMAFLRNMIAIELLLTRQGDKYATALPERVEAFLGWTGYWSTSNYETRIQELYQKRCDLVHRGKRADIGKHDLLFTDDLLLNLLMNLVTLHRQFPSKQAVIQFAERVKAEHILGIKSRVRPKNLRFIARTYTAKDLREI